MNPQMKPTIEPQMTERMAFCFAVALSSLFFGSTDRLYDELDAEQESHEH